MISWLMGKLGEAEEAAQRGIRIGLELGDVGLLARAQDVLGRTLFSRGRYPEAKEVLRRNIAMLTGTLERERFGFQGFIAVFSRHFWVRSCAVMGMFEEGRTGAEEALRIAGDHPHSVLSASSAIAVVARERGDFQVAASTMERALALCESLDIRVWAASLGSDLGYAYLFLGRVPEGVLLLERAVAGAGSDASLLTRLSIGYLHAGRADDALATAQRALTVATGSGEQGSEAEALRTLGDIASHDRSPDTALAISHYQRALELAEPRSMRPLVAHCHLGLGKLDHRTGKREQAQEHLATATAMYREMGMTYWLEKAEAEMTKLAG
jgi:tetratricopeptide (TPR) repeat protein